MLTIATTRDGALALKHHDIKVELIENDGIPGNNQATILWRTQALTETELAKAIQQRPNLQWIHVDTTGTEYLEPWKHNNIHITNAGRVQTRGVAEWITTAILWDIKNLATYQRQSDNRIWLPNLNARAINNDLVAFIGTGSIVQQTAPILDALGFSVIATSPSQKPVDGALTVNWETWLDMLPHATFMVVACESNEQTHNLVDLSILSICNNICLINVARGNIVAPNSIPMARRQGWVKSAVLDVHTIEPLPSTDPLWDDPNILIVPHDMWRTGNNHDERVELFLGLLQEFQSPNFPNAGMGVV